MAAKIKHDLFKVPTGNTSREAQCEGKHRFPSVSDIAKAMRRTGHKYSPYQCKYCGGWHISGSMNLGTHRKRSH